MIAAARPARRLDDALFAACGLAWAAGLIHVRAAIDHIDEYVLYAIFFEALALGQLLWGAALYRAPKRGLLYAGAVVSVLVALLWVASRTSGLPIGPHPWRPEPVGALDVIATSDEVALALLAALHLRPATPRRLRLAVVGAGVWLILLSSLTLTVPGHGH
jgi:hypothetical protein